MADGFFEAWDFRRLSSATMIVTYHYDPTRKRSHTLRLFIDTQAISQQNSSLLLVNKNFLLIGVWPSGKAQGFDPCIPRFES